MVDFELSSTQLAAKTLVENWFIGGGAEIFRVFGYAGTGKTTMVRKLISDLDLELGTDVLFGAYTGKAAMVMRKHHLPGRTIHSMIYKPVEPNKDECNALQKALLAEQDADVKKRIRKELNDKSQVQFHLREQEETELQYASLLVLDECSMVNDDMLRDLLTFKVPLLVLGDPGQLPPIDGEGALTRVAPDIMLTEIHRQAADNPILDFATRARNGVHIPLMARGGSSMCKAHSLSDEKITSFDQILTGKNKTRQMLNQNIRKLKGFTEIYPMVGDKLICLKNDLNVPNGGLFNGMICEVLEIGELLDTSLEITIRRETDTADTPPVQVRALRAHFDNYFDPTALDNVRWWERADSNEFDFGYAITVHKAQGSQWDNVLVYDDKFLKWPDKYEQRRRWLYTGITRAVETITIGE